jgi:tetraacyldisaccharide 4'-kinase
LITRIRKYNRTAEIIECSHKPQYLEQVLTGERLPLEWLRGKHVGALSAIAAPKSFEDGLKGLGAKVELSRQFADHHRFTEREVTGFLKRCGNRALDAVITTEKDYVRLPRLTAPEVPIYFLRVEIEILSGAESWQSCVDRICKRQAMMAPEKFFA